MSNKHDEEQQQKKRLRERQQAKKQRTVIIRDGEKRTVVRQDSKKCYDIEMIRDFLGQLLLQLRIQHYENQKLLKALDSTDDFQSAVKVGKEVSDRLVEQLMVFQKKYQSTLLPTDSVDQNNATETESAGVIMAILRDRLAKRDEQIGHLEALQDLFEEAIYCARLPFGLNKDGNVIQAQVIYNVRELADQAFLARLPKYEELLPLFSGHFFATDKGIKRLREHDHSILLVATNGAYDQPLVLYGAALAEQQMKAGKSVKIKTISVSSFSELQFIIAAIAKFVGVPSTDGELWKDL